MKERSHWIEVVAVVLSVLTVACGSYNVAAGWPSPGLTVLIMLGVLLFSLLGVLCVFSFLSLPILLLLAVVLKRDKRAAYWRRVQAAAISCVIPVWALLLGDSVQQSAFLKLAERTEPLISAIHRYEAEKGRPPRFLAELVPNFLATFPVTGLPAYPEYKYRAHYPPQGRYMAYWLGDNLTARNPSQFWPRRKYHYGPSRDAILLLTLDHNNLVVEVDTDRLPEHLEEQAFESDRWKKDRVAQDSGRVAMIHDLLQTVRLQGMSEEQVIELLGVPGDAGQFLPHAWELMVSMPRIGADIDHFFYWPTESYPDRLYGNRVIRIGNWAYMYE